MFTETEISEMFRMGTLNGKEIERHKMQTTRTKKEQIKTVRVIVNNREYIIAQFFPYKENLEESKKITRGIPEIIVNYKIYPTEGDEIQ